MQKEMEDSRVVSETVTASLRGLVAELQGSNESLLGDLQALKREVCL